MKRRLRKLLMLTTLTLTSGCASTRVVEFNSAADWILAGPNAVIPSAYVYENGVPTLKKGPFHLVEGSRIGPPK